jgi:spore coat protein A
MRQRRTFSVVALCATLAIVVLFVGVPSVVAQGPGQVPLPGRNIPKFVDPLPTFVGTRVNGTVPLTVSIHEFQQRVLPSTFVYPAPFTGTYVWGYMISDGVNTYGPHYPTFTIEAQRGTPLQITYVNNLPYGANSVVQTNLLIDQTLHWADPLNAGHVMTPYAGPQPAVVHLHGGEVPSEVDGGPDQWFTSTGIHGPGYRTVFAPPGPNAAVYVYPNSQEAATLWFHDHALGATRINVYAGMAGYYFLRDAATKDNGVPTPGGLPAGAQEIELAIQDRMFDVNGQLFWPSVGINPMVHPFWLPEFFGDVIVVNGKTWPYFNVEPRRYRFRILNGSNARFYALSLGKNGPAIWQIGTDGGLLDAPVRIAHPNRLLLAPGERADVIIDFAGFAGKTLLLDNTAKAPFPNGIPADAQTVGQILQFRVVLPLSGTDNTYNPAVGGPLRTAPMVRLVNPGAVVPNGTIDVKRQLTLNEVMGMGGPLEVLVNNTKWMAPMTELPMEGSTELWQIINLTADAHPIHLHLVQFQLVSRQAFQTNKYLKAYGKAFPGGVSPVDGLLYPPGVYIPGFGPPLPYSVANVDGAVGGNPAIGAYLQGAPRPAEPNERGWKDTFVMYPGEVTTVAVRFRPTDVPLGTTSTTDVYPFDPSTGPGYVWHCHIIDHEDNEMMRPYNVQPMLAAVRKAGSGAVASTTKPASFMLEQNYPNPFNPSTTIRFQIPDDMRVVLKLYNNLGQEVQTLIDANAPAGVHTVKLDAKNLASGVYFYRIQAGEYTAVKKMTLLR